jgi:hypothetical protein
MLFEKSKIFGSYQTTSLLLAFFTPYTNYVPETLLLMISELNVDILFSFKFQLYFHLLEM